MPNTVMSSRISESARALSRELDTFMYRRVDGNYRATFAVDTLINWGSGNSEIGRGAGRITSRRVLNSPQAINRASNKLNAFNSWAGCTPRIPTLEYTTSRAGAQTWLTTPGVDKVYCRTTLRGHSGDGIVVAREHGEVVQAPLYTKGVNLHHEFRFHVLNGVVFDGVRKAFSSEVPREERNTDIMNHAAGTIFVRSGPALERASNNEAMMRDCGLAVSQLGLDFGAVDVLTDHNGNHFIIEVNTACGLEGTTLNRYTRAFTEHLAGRPLTPWNITEFTGQPDESNPSENNTQETTNMNISQAAVGNSVIFNPQSPTAIGSLTSGSVYVITRIGSTVIYVRNNSGRIQGYQVAHFNITPAAPVVFEGPSDGSIDTGVPPTSPERIVRLDDGSSVNVTGQATFTGTSRHLTTGQSYTIVDMYVGVDTGDVFLGITVEGDTQRYISTNFTDGEPDASNVDRAVTSSGPRILDSQGRALRVNDKIISVTGAGGHGLAVGTLGTLTALDPERLTMAVRDGANVRIHPNRIKRITQQEYDRIIAEEAALQHQETTSFTIGSHNYRVAQRDMTELHQVLRRFTV